MTAETNMIYDGHYYKAGDELPDLGSLVCTSVEGKIRSYEGKYEDKSLLPKYNDLATGSSALLSNEGTFILYKYYADAQTWEGNGEVL